MRSNLEEDWSCRLYPLNNKRKVMEIRRLIIPLLWWLEAKVEKSIARNETPRDIRLFSVFWASLQSRQNNLLSKPETAADLLHFSWSYLYLLQHGNWQAAWCSRCQVSTWCSVLVFTLRIKESLNLISFSRLKSDLLYSCVNSKNTL